MVNETDLSILRYLTGHPEDPHTDPEMVRLEVRKLLVKKDVGTNFCIVHDAFLERVLCALTRLIEK